MVAEFEDRKQSGASGIDVSVVIVNFNTFQLTCQCIESVLLRTKGCTFEIIVVDNASTDHNPIDFVKRFQEIRLIANTENVGFAKANNAGIAVSHGEYVLLLNSDTELVNDAISICVERMHKQNHIGAIACKLVYPDGTIQHNCQRFPSVRYKLFELLRLQKMLPFWGGTFLLGPFFDHNSPAFPDWVWGTFFMFRARLLELLPDEKLADDFFMYVEDVQWCMDFKRLGYVVAFEPKGKVVHYMGQSKGLKSPLIEKHTDIFMKRYYPRWKRSLIAKLDHLLA